MNNARRKAIRNVIKMLKGSPVDWECVETELSDVLDEESEAMDNIPENLQDSDRYLVCEESVDYLEDAINSIDSENPECAAEVIEILEQIDGV